jgi:hypothetical protein
MFGMTRTSILSVESGVTFVNENVSFHTCAWGVVQRDGYKEVNF